MQSPPHSPSAPRDSIGTGYLYRSNFSKECPIPPLEPNDTREALCDEERDIKTEDSP